MALHDDGAELARMVTEFSALKQRHAALVVALRTAISELSAHIYIRRVADVKSVDQPVEAVQRLMIELHAVEAELRLVEEEMLEAGITPE